MSLRNAFDQAPFNADPREHFASLAMQGFMVAFLPEEDRHYRNIAKASYQAADAMMRVRQPLDYLTIADCRAGLAMQAQLMDYEPQTDSQYEAVAKRSFRMAYAMTEHLAKIETGGDDA